MTNTDKGDVWNGYVKLEKPYKDGWYASASYAYGYARSVNDGTSSQAISNWRFNNISLGPSDEVLGVSVFDVRHRFNAVLSWSKALFGDNKTSLGLYYNHEAGRPFSTTFVTDVNGDAESNDLFYVPASADEVIVRGGTWDQLNAFIEADEGLKNARGSIVGRNASRAPWRHDLDFSFAQELPIASTKLEADLRHPQPVEPLRQGCGRQEIRRLLRGFAGHLQRHRRRHRQADLHPGRGVRPTRR